MIQLNDGLRAILESDDFDLVKTQPPDGFVIELPDGARWVVMAVRQKRRDHDG